MSPRALLLVLLALALVDEKTAYSEGTSSVIPIVLSSGTNKAFGPHGSTLALVDLDRQSSSRLSIDVDISPATRRGLSSQGSAKAFFSDIQGTQLIALDMKTAETRLIKPPMDGYLVWSCQPDPNYYVFQSAKATDDSLLRKTELWIFRPATSEFGSLPSLEGALKRGAIVLDGNHAIISTELGGDTTLWYLGTNGEKRQLYKASGRDLTFTILGQAGGKTVLGTYSVNARGEAENSSLVLVGLDGKVVTFDKKLETGFRLSRFVEVEGKYFALASSSLSETGTMKNRLLSVDVATLKLEMVLSFDYWYSENLYVRNGRIFLFNSFGNDPGGGFMVDLRKKTSGPFQF